MEAVQQAIQSDFDLTEIINGEEIMSPSPLAKHQHISRNLFDEMNQFVKTKKLGETYYSPLDIIFEDRENRLQPDIVFIRKANLGIVRDWIRGVPDLVVEVVSKGSVVMDTVVKKELYERYKVPEYWIVLPALECIEVFVISGNKYALFSSNEGEGTVKSQVLKGFKVKLTDIFQK